MQVDEEGLPDVEMNEVVEEVLPPAGLFETADVDMPDVANGLHATAAIAASISCFCSGVACGSRNCHPNPPPQAACFPAAASASNARTSSATAAPSIIEQRIISYRTEMAVRPAPVCSTPKDRSEVGASAPTGQTQKVPASSGACGENSRVHVPMPYLRLTTRRSHGKGCEPQFIDRAVTRSTCTHRPEGISIHGSNQYGRRMTCMACSTLLESRQGVRATVY